MDTVIAAICIGLILLVTFVPVKKISKTSLNLSSPRCLSHLSLSDGMQVGPGNVTIFPPKQVLPSYSVGVFAGTTITTELIDGISVYPVPLQSGQNTIEFDTAQTIVISNQNGKYILTQGQPSLVNGFPTF